MTTESPSAEDSGFTPRHWIAVTALIAGMVAVYLHLWKLGLTGPLACNAQHSCEAVMFSKWGRFLGVDVALIGAVGYALILITAIVGLQPARRDDLRITNVLTVLIVGAFLFTLRLKYYEWFVMHAFCKWCAISAVTITTHLVAVILDRKRVVNSGGES
jgi:uncharacterized membrane protein